MQQLGARLKERLNRSAFFFGALLFHLVLFLLLVGYVVWQPPAPEKETAFGSVPRPPAVPSPPSAPSNPDALAGFAGPRVIAVDPHDVGSPPTPIHLDIEKGHDLDPGNLIGHDPGPPLLAPREAGTGRENWVNLSAVKQMEEKWHRNGNPDFIVPIYLAKYADGDWDCNSYLHDGQLVSGCLPNLMAKVQDWSNGEIKGRDLQVIALDSRQILDDPPPFIFFTGHKDFQLTAAEVTNLRDYLQMGGMIWGDSALAGDGSRFDVAFHREMKRVLPDKDLPFEPLPADHDIFTKSRFPIDELPSGMNRRTDPIECINLGGKLAILYTPNDYGDMMTMLLLPGRDERDAQADSHDYWTADHPLFTPASFTSNASTFYRNYEPASVMAAYKLSMNILVHLLHRYDDELLLTP